MIHPEQHELNKEIERENRLWWELDKIAVCNSECVPASTQMKRREKASAAENMMRYLHKPTPEWCRMKYDSERA